MILQSKLPLRCPAMGPARNGLAVQGPCTCCLCLKGRGPLSVLGVVLVPSVNDSYRMKLCIHASAHLSHRKHIHTSKKTLAWWRMETLVLKQRLKESPVLTRLSEEGLEVGCYERKGVCWLSDFLWHPDSNSAGWSMFWGHEFWVRFSHILGVCVSSLPLAVPDIK